MKTVLPALLLCTLWACGAEELNDSAGDGCPPGAECICELDSDQTVVDVCIGGEETPQGEPCSCRVVPEDTPPEPPQGPVRFVLVQDESPMVSGETPGPDIDAVGLIKRNGTEVFAVNVSSHSDVSCQANLACDVQALLGAPDVINDGECFGGGNVDTDLFTSLNQGFAIVGFSGGDNGDQIIENGDSIHVYEIGATACGRFDDEPYSVSIAVSDSDTNAFFTLAVGEGSNPILVQGLP